MAGEEQKAPEEPESKGDNTPREEAPGQADAVEEGPPNSWLGIVWGLAVVATALALALAFVHQYLASRPIDLRGHTTDLTAVLEDLLLTHQIPPDNIVRSVSEPEDNGKAKWQRTSFQVRIPDALDPAGVEKLVRRNMTGRGAEVSGAITGHTEGVLSFSYRGLNFATLRLGPVTEEEADPPVKLAAAKADTPPVTDLSAECGTIAESIEDVLSEAGIAPSSIARSEPVTRTNDLTKWTFHELEAPLSGALAADDVFALCKGSAESLGATVSMRPGIAGVNILTFTYAGVDCVEVLLTGAPSPTPPGTEKSVAASVNEAPAAPEFETTVADAPAELPVQVMDEAEESPVEKAATKPQAKVAIIIDDGGWGGPLTDRVLSHDSRLTLAILPDAPFARETAEQAVDRGFEVLVHLPMEPVSEEEQQGIVLRCGMDEKEMRAAIKRALAQVPGAVGINNHCGSRFTSEKVCVRRFLGVLPETGLFFVDSRTASSTVAYGLAQQMGLPAAERTVPFLDDSMAEEDLERAFADLKEIGKEQGRAIGICHFRTSSVAALEALLPELEEEGITLVHVSELVE